MLKRFRITLINTNMFICPNEGKKLKNNKDSLSSTDTNVTPVNQRLL